MTATAPTTKVSDTAYRAGYDATRCTFQPQNGGWADRCRETADWTEPGGQWHTERRCQRHYDIDKRTADRRGWGGGFIERLLPFDAEAHRRAIETRTMQDEAAARDLFWAHLTDAVAARDLPRVRDLAQRGRV